MKNRLGRVIAALIALLCFSLFGAAAQDAADSGGAASPAVAQSTPQVAPQDADTGLAETRDALPQSENSPSFDETKPFGAAVPQQRAMPSVLATAGVFARMILVLAFVIACIYGLVWFMKRYSNRTTNSDQFLRVVASIMLAPGKYVKIVSLLDEKAYMLGVSDNAVNVIAEVESKETIAAMNLYADKMAGASKGKSFEDILNIFMPGGPKNALNGDEAAELLRKTRGQVNNEGDI